MLSERRHTVVSVYTFSIKVDHERESASVLRKNLKFTKERCHSTENMLGKKYLSIKFTFCDQIGSLFISANNGQNFSVRNDQSTSF